MVRGAAEGAAHRGGRSQHRPARGDPPRAEPSSSSPALLSGGEGTSRMNICFLAFQTRPILVGRLAPEAPRVPPLGGRKAGGCPALGPRGPGTGSPSASPLYLGRHPLSCPPNSRCAVRWLLRPLSLLVAETQAARSASRQPRSVRLHALAVADGPLRAPVPLSSGSSSRRLW